MAMQFVDPAFAREILRYLGAHGIAAALISPTATAMHKSIMDATEPFRDFLAAKGIHDFASQPQGQEHKRLLSAEYVSVSRVAPTQISLYRPLTKTGDPRVWFYGLKAYAQPDDVLALIPAAGRLYIVNASDSRLLRSLSDTSTPLGSIAAAESGALSPVAADLFSKLKAISAMGYVQTIRPGDTGVGATLEHLLGIAANSRRAPDYFGIEIKASRHNGTRSTARNRVNLFSQVPLWDHPGGQTALVALSSFGYPNGDRQQLYCTVDALKPNSQGLVLVLNADGGKLLLVHRKGNVETVVFVWQLATLRARLQEKHPESFWVKADVRNIGGVEHFHYHSVVHTRKPLYANFGLAIADGTVSLDLTMSTTGTSVRDHGYLFKIWPADLPILFPSLKYYRL
jgi:hypothetical protein